MRKIVCFGEALIDMLAQPPAREGEPRAFLQHAGGAPANVAVAVARLGGHARFLGMLGEDMFGDFLLESLDGAGVDVSGVHRTDAAKTALAFVALDERGERSFSFYRPPAADLLFRQEHFAVDAFADAAVLHVCSNSMTEPGVAEATFEGMRRARASGTVVSFDLNLRPMLWPEEVDPTPWLWRALALADVVKLSMEELDFLAEGSGVAPQAIPEKLWQGQTSFLIVTNGDGPVSWFTRDASGQVPVFRVPVLDTTAAGDAFVAGLLHGIANQWDEKDGLAAFCGQPGLIGRTLRFASAVGALAVTRKGAFAAMPSLEEVQALMQEQP